MDARDGESRRPLVDLSHAIRDGMVTYPGLPAPEITDHLDRESSEARCAPGTSFHIGRISMVANTGTYVDSPFHRFAEGDDLAALRLGSLADLDGLVVDARSTRAIGLDVLTTHRVGGRAVLLRTGWDRHWETPAYAGDSPFLTEDGARWLVAEGAALVGIDSINIDATTDGRRPAHTTLLAAGIPIVEHLCRLDQLPAAGFRFHAVPPMIERFGTFPVRAYAVLNG